jgi:GDPmannose 4,6-dehydratase
MKTALITGVTGQDGCYLARLLLEKHYRVVGVIDSRRESSLIGLNYVGVLPRIELTSCSMEAFTDVQRLILQIEPDEIYHLASQSSVAESFRQPAQTMQANTRPIINLLEAVRTVSPIARIYHASSSEMYGKVDMLPISESTLFHPLSPYGVSKVAAHHIVACYRDSYNLFAVSGILFNHESVLRRENFFTRKVIREAINARTCGLNIAFGNLDVKRDIGYAPQYVDAMWRMLQQAQPYDFVICSGKSVSLRALVEHVFRRLDVPTDRIHIDPELFRPNEIADIYGSNLRAKEELGWEYELTAFEVMDLILSEELERQAAVPRRGE